MKRREFLTAASVAGGAAAATGSAAAETETSTPGGTATGTSTGGNATATGTTSGGGGGQNFTWTVDMTDENVYEPAELQVRPGDTVVWENVGTVGHTITAYEENIPDGADYWASGGFSSEEAARSGYPDDGVVDGGGTYERTFETEGVHEYFCIPHESVGMKGAIEVTPDAPTPTPAPSGAGGGRRDVDPEHMGVPFQAHYVGLATALMVVASLVFTFYVLKYGESPNFKGGNN
jgi:plastocyanin